MVVYESSGGLVEVAFALGLILGFFLTGVMAWFLLEIRKRQFRTYYVQMDDASKKDVMDRLDYVRGQYEFLATRTNTTQMKAEYNTVHGFIERMKRKQMP